MFGYLIILIVAACIAGFNLAISSMAIHAITTREEQCALPEAADLAILSIILTIGAFILIIVGIAINAYLSNTFGSIVETFAGSTLRSITSKLFVVSLVEILLVIGTLVMLFFVTEAVKNNNKSQAYGLMIGILLASIAELALLIYLVKECIDLFRNTHSIVPLKSFLSKRADQKAEPLVATLAEKAGVPANLTRIVQQVATDLGSGAGASGAGASAGVNTQQLAATIQSFLNGDNGNLLQTVSQQINLDPQAVATVLSSVDTSQISSVIRSVAESNVAANIVNVLESAVNSVTVQNIGANLQSQFKSRLFAPP